MPVTVTASWSDTLRFSEQDAPGPDTRDALTLTDTFAPVEQGTAAETLVFREQWVPRSGDLASGRFRGYYDG